MSEERMINILDAILYVDIRCYKCKKEVALSNTHEIDGRRYCSNCWWGIGEKNKDE